MNVFLVVFCLFFIGTNNIFADTDLPDCEYDSLQDCYDDRIKSSDPSPAQTEAKNYCERTCNPDGVIVSPPVYQGEYVKCGNSSAFPSALPKFTRILISILQIFTPIMLIVLGMIDFMKAVAGENSEGFDKAKKKFVNRIIAGCAVFLVFTIVKFAVSSFATSDNAYMQCASCFINNSNNCQNATYVPLSQTDSDTEDESTTHESSSGATHGGSGGNR